jgi:tRNA(adenine34) deaminase
LIAPGAATDAEARVRLAPARSEDTLWMARALEQARAAAAVAEVPVGAVLVHRGRLLAEGHNLTVTAHDPTAHAEVVTLREGAQRIGDFRLVETTLYVTLEPCAMCAAAIAAARLARLYYGAADPKSGGVEHGARVFAHPQAHHVPEIYAGIAEAESASLLRAFFRARR